MEDHIIKRLYQIKERPGMFIGHPSLLYLYFHIKGYHARECEIQGCSQPLLPGFQEYVQNKYRIHTDRHWVKIISFYEPAEEQAFHRFYQLLDDFLKETANPSANC